MAPNSTQAWHHRRVNTRWVDTHAHLDRFEPELRAEVFERAREEGVAIIGVSTNVPSAVTLVGMKPLAGVAIGVHPKHAGVSDPAELSDLAAHAKNVIAIGECGFDAAGPPMDVQAEAFAVQANLAREHGLPLVLHIDGEGAWEQFCADESVIEGVPIIRHYFTGDAAQADWHAERGHFLSFGNPLRRTAALRDIVYRYPPELLLIESDAYPLPGRNTEPRDVRGIAETMALIIGWTFAEAEQRLRANTKKAFPRLRLR